MPHRRTIVQVKGDNAKVNGREPLFPQHLTNG